MTAKPLNFILNSDYATIKNDSTTQTFTLSVPATTLTTGDPYILSQSFTAGVTGAPIDCDINYSMTTLRVLGLSAFAVENTSTASQYSVVINIFRDSETTIKLKVNIYPVFVPVTLTARTITIRVRTFIPPFA